MFKIYKTNYKIIFRNRSKGFGGRKYEEAEVETVEKETRIE